MALRVKKFTGKSIADALAKAQREFGKDIVFETIEEPKKGGFFKLIGRQRCVIVAGPTSSFTVVDSRAPAAADARGATARRELLRQKYGSYLETGRGCGVPPQSRRPSAAGDSTLNETLMEVKQMLSTLSSRIHEMDTFKPRHELAEVYLRLLDSEVSTFLARRILEGIENKLGTAGLKNARVVDEAVRNVIEDMISVAGPIELSSNSQRRIAFVGPTGVGKTSTIAKLAGHFVRMKKLVGTITVDTYKLGATEQLAHFASILRIPLAIVRDPTSSSEVNKALHAMRDRDVVLIDTFGESPRNSVKLQELKRSLELLKPHETHLVLSCTTHPDALQDALDKFSIIHIDKLILTKTDEATKFGLLLNVLQKVSTGLSYIANGQAIPEDIEEATAKRVADLVLGGTAK